ncbi:hypothetical protein DPX16_2210 [Anabarilius grahami]|uniref:Uncharacterized protein n=1 Tax=Anabarilius grahami TaxID=495550 RepID=A0A3N0Z6I4_ANAGA|nr:hypothetical protein DPX16_2210 [Anabarilius grahami]
MNAAADTSATHRRSRASENQTTALQCDSIHPQSVGAEISLCSCSRSTEEVRNWTVKRQRQTQICVKCGGTAVVMSEASGAAGDSKQRDVQNSALEFTLGLKQTSRCIQPEGIVGLHDKREHLELSDRRTQLEHICV